MAEKRERKTDRKRRGRGEGGIYQRADGLWCGSVSAGYNATGKRRRQVVYGESKREVQEKLREAQKRGVPNVPRLTLGEHLDRWLETAVKPKRAPSTHSRYEQVVRLYLKPHLGHMLIGKVEPLHVQHLYAALESEGASPRQRELAGVVLQKAMKSAVGLRLIPFNPCVDVEKPRPAKREMRVWNKSQVDAFLKAAAADRLSALYTLAIATGLREGELFGLEWGDVDFDEAVVTVNRTLEEIGGHLRTKEPKTAAGRRRVDLPAFAVEAMQEHRKRMLAEGHATAPVFCDTAGGYLRVSNVLRRSFRPTIAKANEAAAEQALKVGGVAESLPIIRFHDLRHTAATLALLAGVPVKVVSERLGHADIAITLSTYAHVLPTMGKDAAEKLNRLFG